LERPLALSARGRPSNCLEEKGVRPTSPALRLVRASVIPASGSWQSCPALKHIAQRHPPSACPSSAPRCRRSPTPHRCRPPDGPLERAVPSPVAPHPRHQQQQNDAADHSCPAQSLCHWLNALAFTRANQPCHVERTHPPPRLVIQAIQKRLQPTSKLALPIRRCPPHGRPSKSRPPMNHRQTDLGIPDRLSPVRICQSSASARSQIAALCRGKKEAAPSGRFPEVRLILRS